MQGEVFELERGVKQGDPLLPNLFNAALEGIFRNLDWEGKSLNVNGQLISSLRFADDIVIISEDIEELKIMAKELIKKKAHNWSFDQYLKNENNYKWKRSRGGDRRQQNSVRARI